MASWRRSSVVEVGPPQQGASPWSAASCKSLLPVAGHFSVTVVIFQRRLLHPSSQVNEFKMLPTSAPSMVRSLVRLRGAESGVSLSPLCSVRASCLSLVNLVPGVPGSQREGVWWLKLQRSTKQSLGILPRGLWFPVPSPSRVFTTFQFTCIPPRTTPLSRLNLFGGIWEPLAPEPRPLCLEDV